MAQPAQQRGRAIGGSMSAARVRGWCPSLFEPMAAGDGLLVRVKPHVGGVSAAQLRVLAAAAERFGSGRIEITNRANFQLRGFSAETVPGFAAAMLKAGLASADPAAERRRNIFVSLWADPIGMALARQLEDWLERETGLDALPSKFGFSVGEVAADINILPGRDAPVVVLPGGFTVVAPAPLQAVQALTQAFLRQAERITPRPARMRALLAAIGAEAVFAEAGLRMERVAPVFAAPSASVGKMPDAFGLGLAFGVQDGATLRRAAELAERFGDGVLRTMRARSLVVMGVGEDGIAAAAQAMGFITEPGDVRLRIAACSGRPACPHAFIDARAVATGLAGHWAGQGLLHVSACAKGCAAPEGAAVTLVATGEGDRYDIVLNGKAGDVPNHAGLSLNDAMQWMTEKSRTQ
jgi:precorrin-3B synthase